MVNQYNYFPVINVLAPTLSTFAARARERESFIRTFPYRGV